MSLNLRIVSPEKVEFVGTVDRVVVPVTSVEVEILTGHAPIISTLNSGRIAFFDSEGEHEVKTRAVSLKCRRTTSTFVLNFNETRLTC